MSNILNAAVEKDGILWLIDNFRFYQKIDGTKSQIMISGWIFEKEEPARTLDVTAESLLGLKFGKDDLQVSVSRMERKDVCDMYDVLAPQAGFCILLEGSRDTILGMQAEEDSGQSGRASTQEVPIFRIAAAGTTILEINRSMLEEHQVDNVHHMIDQFALNGNVIRMAGWGYLSDLYEEYRPLTVWAETDFPDGVLPSHVGEDQISPNGKYMIGKAQYMLRPDIISLFSTPEDQGRQWGFFLLLDMTEYASCDICFGEKGCNKKWHIDIEELRREKREKRRKYLSKWEMLTKADPMQRADDKWYKKNLSKEEYDAIIANRLKTDDVDYDAWMRRHVVVSGKELEKQRKATFERTPRISLAVPAFRTPEKFLREMIESVQNQTYTNWELCIADGSLDGSLTPILEEYHAKDSRIRYATLDANYGISGNTNKALELAEGDFIALLDHDDILTPDALFENVKRINEMDADCIYSDEDKVDFDLEDYFEPHFKPDFNLDMLRSCNYICHFFVVRKDVLERAGLFREEYDGSQDFDFILRCTSEAKRVEHIRKMLYHWRSHAASTAMNPENKMYCYTAGRKAIHDELVRKGYEENHVENYTRLGYYEPIYPVTGAPKVVLVTYESNETAIEELQARGDWYENTEVVFAHTENQPDTFESLIECAAHYINGDKDEEKTADYLFFVDGTLKDASENWIQMLLGNALRPEVGVIGPMVYNELGRISSSGKLIMSDGRVRDMFKGLLKEEPGYAAHALMQQDVSAVSNHCFMIRRDAFDALTFAWSNVEENHENRPMKAMTIFCDELMKQDKLVVYTPFIQVKEKESPISEEIKVTEVATGESDPHYHPAFDENGEMFTLRL